MSNKMPNYCDFVTAHRPVNDFSIKLFLDVCYYNYNSNNWIKIIIICFMFRLQHCSNIKIQQ